MKKQINGKKRYNTILYVIIGLLFILWAFRIDLINTDNTFTLRLVQHPVSELIKLDALDVHPPLYYLILKLFFTVTFISHASPFIQIIAGRVFNVLLLGITLIVMRSILNKLTGQKFSFAFLSLVCLFPMVIWHSTGIRMYVLSALFIACELNSIINFNRDQRIRDIVLATVFAALGAWTHYFTAIIAGLLLFYNFVIEKHRRIPYLISGIVFFISFIPWLKISMSQVSSVKHSYWIKNNIEEYFGAFVYQRLAKFLGSKLSLCFAILFLACLIYITIKTLKSLSSEFQKYYVMVTIVLFGTILLGFILSVLIRPIFQGRYVFGISLIYFVMTLPLIAAFFSSSSNNLRRVVKGCLILLICAGTALNLLLGAYYNLKSVNVYRNARQLENSSAKVINADNEKVPTLLMNSYLVQDKTFTNKHYGHLTSQSDKLFKGIYPNIKK